MNVTNTIIIKGKFADTLMEEMLDIMHKAGYKVTMVKQNFGKHYFQTSTPRNGRPFDDKTLVERKVKI